MKRGDVVVVRFPHPSGQRGKKRPAVVVQSDAYASAVRTVVVAEVTKNLTMKDDPACLFIDLNTSERKATGAAGRFGRFRLGARYHLHRHRCPGAGKPVTKAAAKTRRLLEQGVGTALSCEAPANQTLKLTGAAITVYRGTK